VDRILKEALSQLEMEVQQKRAKIAIEGPFPPILAHAAIFRQVMVNLVSNGIKFVTAGVHPEVRIRSEVNDSGVRLWVEDNGIGIAAEHQERIFRVFERLHEADSYPGTGIGLAIVCKGVERMGGQVGVQSAPGQGSRFWLQLAKAV
jgi:signal transduction histidine kinase